MITMNGKVFLKPLDVPVIVISVLLTIYIAVSVYSGTNLESQVIIQSSEKSWIYPLNSEVKLSIKGPIGETIVEINNGKAAIISSPCPGQTCVTSGYLSKNGHWAACLPNRVFVFIEGSGNEEGIDAASW